MTRKTRRTIFYALVAVFILLGVGVTLYAQGWRLDLATGRAEKVGAIYVRSFPADAHITLNGKPIQNQIGFFSRGTLVGDLFPRTYDLALTEPGYIDWHENAPVIPSLVTEFNDAVLVPKTPAAVGTTSIQQFADTAGGIILQAGTGAIIWRGVTIARGTLVGGDPNSANVIFKSSVTGDYLLYNLTESTSTDISMIFAKNGIATKNISSLAIDPYDATEILGESGARLWIVNPATADLMSVGSAPAGAALSAPLAIAPSLIAWTISVKNFPTSTLFLYHRFAQTVTTSSVPFQGIPQELKWVSGNSFGFLQSDGSLFLYDANAGQLQKLADDVKDFAVAADGSAIAALENESLEVLPLADTQTYHRFNVPDVADARSVAWYRDANHLFVTYPDHISLLDLDDLGLRNFTTVTEGTSPLYNPQENVLYVINSTSKLEQFDFPS